MERITEGGRELPIVERADVVVAGGGPGGFAAAVAAAREGARVVLVERYGYAGGLATAGLVNPILGHTAAKSATPIVEGILKELVERMNELGGAASWEASLGRWGVDFEAEAFKYAADMMLDESKVTVRFHTAVAATVGGPVGHQAAPIEAIVTESKSGREALVGSVFVDATGDADLVAFSGAGHTMGRAFDGAVQSMGSFIHFGGMSDATSEQLESAKRRLEERMRAGEVRVYNSTFNNPGPKRSIYFAPNMTRFSGDPTSAEDLSRGERAVRREAWKLLSFLREQPGLEDACILHTSPCIGPRESRQLIGCYTLTGADVREGRRFEDAIARGSWWIDIHCPLGYSFPVHLCTRRCPKGEACSYWAAEHDGDMLDVDELYPPEGGWYDIPYRSLVTETTPNLIVAGRAISADHQGMAGARVMGTCMAIGEAAGVAAAMASRAESDLNAVDVGELRNRLAAAGALV